MLPRPWERWLLRKPKRERIEEMQVGRGRRHKLGRRSWEPALWKLMEDPANRAGVPACVRVGGRGILQ